MLKRLSESSRGNASPADIILSKHHSVKPQNQLLGQLPAERVSPAPPFEKTGVDYAEPFQIKYGHVRKPVVVKTYICLFVCLTVKATHPELVSDLTTESLIGVKSAKAHLKRVVSS